MKQFKQLLARMHRKTRRQNKSGSTMALVMIIMSALVIWVMCLAPLLGTTGTTAAKVQNGYIDYLSSRSAIEFAKSELEYIVRDGSPYTFAVIKNGNTYSTVAKTEATYSQYVIADLNDDTLDTPNMYGSGSSVAAISAVSGPDSNGHYEILIMTFNNGKKGMSFRVQFQETGSLLIVPEAYEQTAALPINDFILVDGKLGSNKIWNSDIKYDVDLQYIPLKYVTSVTDSDKVNEVLLPWKLNFENDTDYANSGKYPAVFKGTAQAATGTTGTDIGGTPLVEEEYETKEWILPFSPLEEGGSNNDVGAVYVKNYNNNANRYQVFLRTKNGEKNITTACAGLYLNGNAASRSGSDNNQYFDVTKLITDANNGYRITVDYNGSGGYNTSTSSSVYNALGRKGLVVKEYAGNTSAFVNPAPSISASLSVSVSGNTMTVNVNGVNYDNAQYYSTATGAWQTSNRFVIENPSEVYYFYVYVPSRMENGKITEASGAVCVGGVVGIGKPVKASELDSSKQYWIMNSSGYAMQHNGTNLSAQEFVKTFSNTSGGHIEFGTDTNSAIYKLDFTSFNWRINRDSKTLYSEEKSDNSTITRYLNLDASFTAKKNYPEKKNDYQWNYSVSLSNSNSALTFEDTAVYRAIASVDVPIYKKSSSCNADYKQNGTVASGTTKSYLTINNSSSNNNNNNPILTGSISASNNNSTIYYVEAPQFTVPKSIPTPSSVPTDDVQVTSKVEDSTWASLYANGEGPISNLDSLRPGNYILTGYSDTHYLVTTYSVKKADLSGDFSVAYEVDPNDECKITITGTSSSGDNGGNRYIGYAEVDIEGNVGDYHWFPANSSFAYTVRIPHNTYRFAFMESGTSAYASREVVYDEVVKIAYVYLEFTEDDLEDFQTITWTYNDSKPTYYLPMPEGITLGRLTLVFGIPGPSGQEGDISWSTIPYDNTIYYGFIIKDSNYSSIPNVIQISQPLPLTNNNGHTSSLIRGQSVYFMNGTASINTYNNIVYVYSDLLVLNGPIITTDANKKNPMTSSSNGFEAQVKVAPYSKSKVLLFAASEIKNSAGQAIFEYHCYYELPKNTDIYNLNPETAATYKVGCYAPGTANHDMVTVNGLFKDKYYPEISYDVAFANKDQLSRVISGETIGWTKSGVFQSGSDDGSLIDVMNEQLAVSAYVTSFTTSGSVKRNANRILLASPDTVTVPINTQFTTRYLSLDTPEIKQSGGSTFKIYNLGQDESMVKIIGDILGSLLGHTVAYSSKTLQIDFERQTNITLNSGTSLPTISAQICRYDSGSDLFGNNSLLTIMTPYTVKEIMDLNPKNNNSTIRLVDRYIYLTGDQSNPAITLSARNTMNVEVFANYIHITNSVTGISTTTTRSGTANFIINSQEYGYDQTEYLGIFKVVSGEPFSGTLIRIDAPLSIMINGWAQAKTIPAGFYYVEASVDGTPISAIALAIEAANGRADATSYWVTEEELRQYNVILDSDQSNAYVDTGLWGSSGTGSGSNFYGGTVE